MGLSEKKKKKERQEKTSRLVTHCKEGEKKNLMNRKNKQMGCVFRGASGRPRLPAGGTALDVLHPSSRLVRAEEVDTRRPAPGWGAAGQSSCAWS